MYEHVFGNKVLRNLYEFKRDGAGLKQVIYDPGSA
jgi:hypothetical protein